MKKSIIGIIIFCTPMAAIAKGSWVYNDGLYASIESKMYEVSNNKKAHRNMSFHLMHFHQKNELITSFTLPKTYSRICGTSRGITYGDYKEVDVGIATINNTYVKFIAVCNAENKMAYNQETKQRDNSFNWSVELQPTNQNGSRFIIDELTNGNDLKLQFDIIPQYNEQYFLIENSNFNLVYKSIREKVNAL